MKYCSKCKKLVFSDDEKCTCGKKLTDKIENDLPLCLVSANGVDKDRIKALLDENGIPNSMQFAKRQSKVTSVPGIETAEYTFYVPLGFYKKSIDLLVGTSDMELPDNYDLIPESDESQWEEMSPFKRNAVRLLSGLGFIVLVWLCVAGVDFIANLLSSVMSR